MPDAPDDKPDPSDDKPIDRRRFFRQGLRELFKPLAKAIDPFEQTARQLGAFSAPHESTASATSRPVPLKLWLRPPGAVKEVDFLNTCSRCGTCATVCPVQCIKIDSTGESGAGAPYINADSAACALCASLACMNSCPSGALVPVPLLDIDMGTAVWKEQSCVRETKSEDCTICVDHCPLGTAAIELIAGKVVVKPLACVGCGVCQHDCPTDPKSIVVIPKSARES